MQKLSVSLIKVWSLLFLLMLASLSLPAQKNNKNKNSDENFKIDSLPTILLRELNRFRTEKGLGKLEFSDMLIDAAYLSADDMASSGKDKVEDKKSKKYLKKSGATPRGEQVTMKAR
jgi:uncharacterized protein YkwD